MRPGVQAVDVRDLRVELVDGVADRKAGVADDRGGEQGVGIGRVERELRTDLVNVGDVAALGLVEEVQQCMTVELDPDEVVFGNSGDPVIVTFVSSISLLSLTELFRSMII